MEHKQQPHPYLDNKYPDVWELVLKDMSARNNFGKEKYGVGLKPFNGRDTLQDAYEEALDLCVYLRTAIYERNQEGEVHSKYYYDTDRNR